MQRGSRLSQTVSDISFLSFASYRGEVFLPVLSTFVVAIVLMSSIAVIVVLLAPVFMSVASVSVSLSGLISPLITLVIITATVVSFSLMRVLVFRAMTIAMMLVAAAVVVIIVGVKLAVLGSVSVRAPVSISEVPLAMALVRLRRIRRSVVGRCSPVSLGGAGRGMLCKSSAFLNNVGCISEFLRLNRVLCHCPVRGSGTWLVRDRLFGQVRTEEIIVGRSWLLVLRRNGLDLLGHQRPLDQTHRSVVVVLITASLTFVQEEVLCKRVTLLTPVLNQAVPIGILFQTTLVADDPQEVLCPCDRHIHASVVPEEAKTLRPDGRDDNDVFFSALVRIHCVNLDVTLATQTQLVLNLRNR